ncbi:plasmolipin isoform X3 [Lagenorhynchus albirostris]|uniref:plasmolipin isoform X3 n=2 Tax=Lagenorhynchus albirostris TaxID=27610 RepID=UPI0028F0031F|nr:plasmolipin isoform X3 [Lagenorhynchus albirostris]
MCLSSRSMRQALPGTGDTAMTKEGFLGRLRSSRRTRVALVLGLLVWALIADTSYHLYPAYGWVMFVAVFLWLVTIVFFILYLFQLHMKLYMVPWPLVLMIFNVGATVLYITAFIACSASVELTSLKGTRQYNQRAAASFFSCLVMIAYGVSAFFSFQAWRGVGSNAATSQMAGGYA